MPVMGAYVGPPQASLIMLDVGQRPPPTLVERSSMRYTMIPSVPAVDLQRARAWYKEKLGLDPVTVNGEPFDPEANQVYEEMLYDTGTAMFGVYESPHAGRNLATAARLVTDEFDSVHAQLRANGVEFEEYPIEDYRRGRWPSALLG